MLMAALRHVVDSSDDAPSSWLRVALTINPALPKPGAMRRTWRRGYVRWVPSTKSTILYLVYIACFALIFHCFLSSLLPRPWYSGMQLTSLAKTGAFILSFGPFDGPRKAETRCPSLHSSCSTSSDLSLVADQLNLRA